MAEETKAAGPGVRLDPEALEAAAVAWWDVVKVDRPDGPAYEWAELVEWNDDRIPRFLAALEAGILEYRRAALELVKQLTSGPVARASVVKGYVGPLDPGKIAHRLAEAEAGAEGVGDD